MKAKKVVGGVIVAGAVVIGLYKLGTWASRSEPVLHQNDNEDDLKTRVTDVNLPKN